MGDDGAGGGGAGLSTSGSGASATGGGGQGASATGGQGQGGSTTSSTTTSSTTSSSSTGGSGAAGQLDPDLGLPDPNGQPCAQIGYGGECPGIAVCRISGPDSGTCESCGICGNLGASCTKSSECDILFQCYQGVCTNLCPLGTSYCGAVQDCLDVGHATYGVCAP